MIFTPVLSSLLVTASALEHYARTVPAVVDRVRAAQIGPTHAIGSCRAPRPC